MSFSDEQSGDDAVDWSDERKCLIIAGLLYESRVEQPLIKSMPSELDKGEVRSLLFSSEPSAVIIVRVLHLLGHGQSCVGDGLVRRRRMVGAE